MDEVCVESFQSALLMAAALAMAHAWEQEKVSAISITTDGEEYDPAEDAESEVAP